LRETGEEQQLGGIADKTCLTEALLARAKLTGSMGIVKRDALTNLDSFLKRRIQCLVAPHGPVKTISPLIQTGGVTLAVIISL
jgi:hypothetical protein